VLYTPIYKQYIIRNIDANYYSYTHHIKELFCLPKEKDMTSHQQLDFNDRYNIHGQ